VRDDRVINASRSFAIGLLYVVTVERGVLPASWRARSSQHSIRAAAR